MSTNVKFHRVRNYSDIGEGQKGHVYFVSSTGLVYIYNGTDLEQYGEDYHNKVTSISSSSTDSQYPSAKAVNNRVVEHENIIAGTNSGHIKTGYTGTGKNYALSVDSSGNAYTNVPWTDTDTKVTSETNHYTPVKSTTKSASGASGTIGSTVQVITGIELDSVGHVTGIVSGAATDTRDADTIDGYHISVVSSMPTTPDNNTIYIIK